MFTYKVILDGKEYRLPDASAEKNLPVLTVFGKGLNHIFNKVISDFPGHGIEATWDEDNLMLTYSSDTLSHSQISESLKEHNGIEI